MPLEFIYLSFLPFVAVNCDSRENMGREKAEKSLKNQKIDNIEFRKNTMTKKKSDLKSIKS